MLLCLSPGHTDWFVVNAANYNGVLLQTELTAWIKVTLNQMESCNVQWSTSSDGLFSSQLTKPCTAVSLPEQRCQNNLVPHVGAVCSLITFRLFKTLFFSPLLLRSLVSILTYSLQLLLQISCCCLMRKICNNNEIIFPALCIWLHWIRFFFSLSSLI